ncbi:MULTISPECIES: prephenate dehydrogenase [Vagococcus]|uniref:prephenate dehydrogenase n=1 Tax=Vagococcus TaxID=2737 RepID=UPI002FC60DC9
MKKIENVLLIGVGLIGSSLGLCIKEEHPEITIVGFSHQEEELKGAQSYGIIDTYSLDLQEAAKQADVIILCTPVMVTMTLLEKLSYFDLKKDVIVTDVGSTKVEILKQARWLKQRNYTFIGGHPMAGSHKSGFIAADKDLFENAYYILVTESDELNSEKNLLRNLFKGTRAKFLELEPETHDRITGVLSHMPHLIASQLVEQAKELMDDVPEALNLAAGGFRDITRIASSDPLMWTDISLSNSSILIEEIDKWTARLVGLKEALTDLDEGTLFQFFKGNKEVRDTIPVHKEGSLPGFHDLYLNVPDYPGAIAEVTGVLAKEKISLVNIKIMETRDDIFGVLCVSFKNEKDLERAKIAVSKQTIYDMVNQ